MFGGSSNSGGLFGGQNQANKSTPFGATNNTSGGLFGSTGTTPSAAPSTGLFGSNTSTSTSLFGGNKPSTSTTGSTNLFGNSSTNTGGTGLFGNTNTSNTGGLFGTNTNTNTSTGLFGSTNNTASSGLFGSSTNTTSTGLFGSNNTNTNTGLFGQKPTNTGLFGNNTNSQQNASGGGLFGSTSLSNPMQNNQATNAMPNNNGMNMAPWWYRELTSLEAAYAPSSQGNKFQTIMYEVIGVAPDLLCVSGAVAPAHIEYIKTNRKNQLFQMFPWLDQREWLLAEQRNPDPSNLMPTPIVGIDAVYNRVGQQMSHVRNQLQMLTSAEGPNAAAAPQQPNATQEPAKPQNQLVEYKEKGTSNWLGFSTADMYDEKIDLCRHEHSRLTHRLIKVVGRLERLQCQGTRITQAETEFDKRLTQLRKKVEDSNGCKALLSELGAQLKMEEKRDNEETLFGMQEEEEKAIFGFLEFQRDGLEQLMDIVRKDMRDLKLIQNRLAPHSRN